MSKEPNRKPWPKKLLVEGSNDVHVIGTIRKLHQLADNFEIVDCKGVDSVADTLISYILKRVDVIGIVIDADDKLTLRWEKLRNVLREQGYVVSDSPDQNGTIIQGTGRNPRIGIWLMPDNEQPGMLEHFMATLIPHGDKLKPIAEEIVARLEADKLSRFKSVHTSKAIIHTWLAWQEDPGTPMGQAITKTYLNHNTELCQRFVTWLDTLFNA